MAPLLRRALLSLLLAAAASAVPATTPAAPTAPSASPAPKTSKAADPAFDSTRAFRYLKEQCALGPRNPESAGHKKAIAYFTAHFKSLGLAVTQQAFMHTDMTDGHKVPLTNLIVKIPGSDPKRKPVVFCAHWDTRPRADQETSQMLVNVPIIGANDGASGTAIVMELANLMSKRKPLQTVYLVLFDGEDYGHEGNIEEYFLGARHFAENLPAPDLEYVLLFDMVGDKDLRLPMEQNSLKQSPDLVRKIWARAASLGLKAFEARPGPAVLDDHMPIQAKGIPAIDIIDFEYPPWHTQGDTPDKCSAHSLGVVGRLAASLAFRGLP